MNEDNFNKWVEDYQPMLNDNGEDNPYDNLMYETFGKDLEAVQSYQDEQIWTIIEEDGKTYIVPGFRVVNRIGYFITEIIWDNKDLIFEI